MYIVAEGKAVIGDRPIGASSCGPNHTKSVIPPPPPKKNIRTHRGSE